MGKVKSMKIKQKEISATGIKFYINKDDKEVARAYLYLIVIILRVLNIILQPTIRDQSFLDLRPELL